MSRNTKRDEESGQFAGEVSDQEIIRVLESSAEPVMTAGEVAEHLPIGKDSVTYRLNKMQERGLVERKDAGARAVVWWSNVEPAPEPVSDSLEKYRGTLDTEKTAAELVEEAREEDEEREERLMTPRKDE